MNETSKNWIGLKNVIKELIDTEVNYVKQLHEVNAIYIKPISEKQYGVPRKLLNNEKSVFGNWNELHDYHYQKVLKQMAALHSSKSFDDVSKTLSTVFCEENMIKFDKLYFDYAKNFESALKLVDVKKSPDYCAFFEKLRSETSDHKLNINSFLIMPIQRITRYPLLIKAIIKYCEKEMYTGLVVQKSLNDSLDAVQQLVGTVNDKLKAVVNLESLPREVQEGIKAMQDQFEKENEKLKNQLEEKRRSEKEKQEKFEEMERKLKMMDLENSRLKMETLKREKDGKAKETAKNTQKPLVLETTNPRFPMIPSSPRTSAPKNPGTCYKCNLSIETETINFRGEKYHLNCFTCTTCKNPLETSTKILIDDSENPICASCHENTLTTCFGCNKKIHEGCIVKAVGREYHDTCFCCYSCGTNLNGQKFSSNKNAAGELTDESKPYCVKCYGDKYAKRCSRCSNIIFGDSGKDVRIVIGDEEYHEDCFVCSSEDCFVSLNEGAYPVLVGGGKSLFCKKHATEMARR